MKIFIFTLLIAVLLAYLAEYYSDGSFDEHGRINLNKSAVAVLIAFLTFVSGFRYMNYFLSDEYNYRVMAMAMEGKPISVIDVGLQKEWIFSLLSWISANVFHDSQFLIFISAALTNISIVLFFVKYARPFWFVIFLYICGGAYFTSMNVLRQYLALAIVLWCYPLAKNSKLVAYMFLLIVASGIHQSVWIMLPAYFLLRKEKLDVSVIILIAATVVIAINFESVMTIILPSISTYEHFLEDFLEKGYGVKLIRILAWMVPYVCVIIFHKRIHRYRHVEYNLIYATIVAACISALSYQYVYVARLDVYFSLAALCTIIRVPELFEKKGRNLVTLAMVCLFFAFGCYQMMGFSEYHNVLFENLAGVILY